MVSVSGVSLLPILKPWSPMQGIWGFSEKYIKA